MRKKNEFRIRPERGAVAVLFSGGLDSAVLAAETSRKRRAIHPLFIRAGLIWEEEEIASARRFIRAIHKATLLPLTILELPMRDLLGKSWSTTGQGTPGYHAPIASNYIIGRNLVLLTKAATYCAKNRIGEIAIATLKDNPFPDATREFFDQFAKAASLALGLSLQISAPFSKLGKAQVIRRGRDLPLELTLSCARPRRHVHCGVCTKCAERQQAFAEAGIPDRTSYAARAGKR